LVVAVLACSVAPGSGWFFGGGPKLDDLRVTWALNPFNSWRFDAMPRTQDAAIAAGWKLYADGCAMDQQDRLPGKKFILNQDLSVILVFDANGFIAGIQLRVPKSKITPGKLIAAAPLVEDFDSASYVLSAYFIHPTRICDPAKSRTADEFKTQGTIDKLFFQVGPHAANNLLEIPATQDETQLSQKHWVKGKCFPTMGRHFWYNVSAELDCSQMMPFFLLYNSGKLNAFGFALTSEFDNANPHRFEHPGLKEAKLCCMDPYPKCFDGAVDKLTTMHVFLDCTPSFNFC